MTDKEQETGAGLRALRLRLKLSTREVAEQSVRLAQKFGNRELKISPSWLARVEREQHELTASKIISLAHIYHVPAEELLRMSRTHETSSSSPPVIPCANNRRSRQRSFLLRQPFTKDGRILARNPWHLMSSPEALFRLSVGFRRGQLRENASPPRCMPALLVLLRKSPRRRPKS